MQSQKKKDEEKVKDLIIKKIFNSANHKKIVKSAARASSLEQQKLIDKYNKMVSC